ncbi:MAG: hypothetical protein OFPI_30550 [Osedax symbiont Rs2]|nr:MAG: hypothetical protein OFPI_30550 [Osedax symbiont Rs2]
MSSRLNQSKKTKLGLIISSILASQILSAADFTIVNGATVTTQQVLNAGDTGTIDVGGTLDVAAGGAVASGGAANQVLNNNGTINANGVAGTGVNLGGSNVTITNTGSINATAINSRGITSGGASLSITNSGSINANSAGSKAVFSVGTNVIITNSGSLHANGANSHAIHSTGTDATINNSGLISASDVTSYAILGDNNDITLNLLSGSNIIGRIDLGGAGTDNDTVNIRSTNISGTMLFENTENVNFLNGVAGTVVKSSFNQTVSNLKVVTVETTGESTRGVALSSFASRVHSLLAKKAIEEAPLDTSNDMNHLSHKPHAWAQVFGGNFERDADGSALAYGYKQSGVVMGYEQDVDNVRIGFMGGYAHTNTNTQSNSFKTKGENLFVGVYSAYKFKGIRITPSVIGGFTKYENERLVIDNTIGAEVAESDFNSVFISPSITIDSAFKISDNIELRPSATLSYSIAWLDGYDEKGTTNSNLSIGSRKAKAFTAKTQLEAAYNLSEASEIALRVGMNSRHIDDDDTNVSIGGSNFSFANSGDQNVTGGFTGVSYRALASNQFNIVLDLEVGGNSKEDYVNGQIGIEYTF